MNIKELQKLEISKITPAPLQKAVQDLLDDYEKAKDKAVFEEIASDNIAKVYTMVEKLSSEAIPKEAVQKKKEKAKESKANKKPSSIKEELDSLTEDIKACRLKIRKYNEEKRKHEPKKSKPTRHQKIKSHFISIINLVPPALKENPMIIKEAEEVLVKAHRDILNAYKMNTLRAKKSEKEIKEKFDQLQEKTKK